MGTQIEHHFLLGAMDLKEECPAFEKGCPFKENDDEVQKAVTEAVDKCPAFKDGCPFKTARSMDDLYALFRNMPHAHSKTTIGSAEKVLVAMLRNVHHQSETMKQTLGTCPSFSTDCPFKETVSNSSLAAALEKRTWNVLASNAEEETTATAEAALAATNSKASEAESPIATEPEKEPPVPFSKEIQQGTKASHKAAENVHFVKNFIRGRIDRELYKQLIADYWHVYQMLEKRLHELASDPLVSKVHFPRQLDRVESLEKDMEFWFGKDWRSSPQATRPTPCTQEYVARLETSSPGGIVCT